MSNLSQVTGYVESGDVKGAVDAALAAVKAQPANVDARRLLIDLLIVAGDFERADKQADILSKTSVELALGMGLLRGRLRAASARIAWFREEAVPAFPEGPTPRDEAAIQLAIARRTDDGVAEALASTTALSETAGITANGAAVESFRDADDRIPHALEVLCTNGSYMWVDFDLIENVDFAEVKAVRDLVWRPTKLTLRDGSETDVVTCATYYADSPSDGELLARVTDWVDGADGVVTGRGQKAFLAGDEAIYAADLASLTKEA